MSYDSLNFARKLKRLGVPEKQADAHAQILTEFSASHLATKSDIEEFKIETKSEFKSVKSELRQEIQEFKTEFKNEFKLVRNEIENLESKLSAKFDSQFLKSQIINGGVICAAVTILFLALQYTFSLYQKI